MSKMKFQAPALLALAAVVAMPALAEMPYVTKIKAQQVASLTFPVPYSPNEEAYTAAAFVWEEADEPYVAKLKAQQIAGLTFPLPYMPRYAPPTVLGQSVSGPDLVPADQGGTRLALR